MSSSNTISKNANSVAENDFIGSSVINQGWNDEPINVNGAQQSSENSKDLLVDNHFYNNFGDIFYEDALKDVMVEIIAAARENKRKEK